MPYILLDDTKAPSEESLLGKTGRVLGGLGARVGETVLGLPGDVQQTLGSIGSLGEKFLPSTKDLESPLLEKGLGYLQAPTSEGLRENVTQKLTGQTLEPKSEWESKLQDFTQDLTSMVTPVPGLGRMKAGKAIAVSGLGNLAHWISKDVGAGEGTQKGIKLGTMLLTSMAGPSGLRKRMADSYSSAGSSIPKNAKVSIKHLEAPIKKIESVLEKGELTPSKKFMLDRINAIKSKSWNNSIPVDEAWELKKNMNEWFDEMPKGVEKLLPSLTKGLNASLQEYGKTNKDFLHYFNEAEDLYKGFNKASRVNSFLQKYVNKDKVGHVAGSLLLGPTQFGHIAGIVSGGVAARATVQGLEALKNSKTIRGHYMKTIASAAARNAAATSRNIKNLDKAINHELPKLGSEGTTESGQPNARFRLID